MRRARTPSWCMELVVLALLLAAGCAGPDAPAAAPSAVPDFGTAAGDAPRPTGSDPSAPAVTTTSEFRATTTAPPAPLRAPEAGSCAFPIAQPVPSDPGPAPDPTDGPGASSTVAPRPDGTTPPPADAREAGLRFARDPRIAGTTRSVSVWIDGIGEAAAENPDEPLIPASNQKLLTALGALRLLDPTERLHTDLVATGPVVDGELQGDLVIVGGGDPTLARTGDRSLESLTASVGQAGIRRVSGRLLVDDSRYDDQRSVAGWGDDWPRWIGTLSALAADHNQYRKDEAFLRDPALGNAELVRFALAAGGIEVAGATAHGSAAAGMRIGTVESPTIAELVTLMLFRSDNFIAEMLVKELAHRRLGASGSTTEGLAAIHDVISQLCAPVGGVDVDGSGFSGADRHSARELRRLLLAAQLQPWGPSFTSAMPVAGQLDALGGRLKGPRTAGNVRAKGGSLSSAKSLSGYLTTASGRNVVFSIVVNGGNLAKAEDAIDDFVTNLATLRT